MTRPVCHLAKDNESAICGKWRVGIEVLVGPLKKKYPRKHFCKKCYDTYWSTPVKQRYIERG